MFRHFLKYFLLLAILLLSSCSPSPASDAPSQDASDTIEYNGITRPRSQVSQETLKWLEWYQSLPQEQQDALSFVPREFANPSAAVAAEETNDDAPPYLSSLTEEDLFTTKELAIYYFTELNPEFEGVDQIIPANDSLALYQNAGIEGEYLPGNIIIYHVQTGKDKKEDNPMRSISIARKSKSDDWKVINSGY